ncbi:hypothetical protein J6590_081109 [Homalodisca vitripennis]|nr:hypothetical protein J6590_081109 [Homalodisca vitripennis]
MLEVSAFCCLTLEGATVMPNTCRIESAWGFFLPTKNYDNFGLALIYVSVVLFVGKWRRIQNL